jgi:hypothetical protein
MFNSTEHVQQHSYRPNIPALNMFNSTEHSALNTELNTALNMFNSTEHVQQHSALNMFNSTEHTALNINKRT